jgi:hypothetical protein
VTERRRYGDRFVNWNENGSPVRRSHFKPDGTIDLTEPIGNEPDIEESLEAMADLHTGRNRSRGHHVDPDEPVQSERERREVEATMELLHQKLWGALNERLNGQGVVVAMVGPGKDFGIHVFAADSERRPCDVQISVDTALQFIGLREESAFRELVEKIAVQILNAREVAKAADSAHEMSVQRVRGN